jgi:rhomboid protease GluP
MPITYPVQHPESPVQESAISLKLRLIYLPFLLIAICYVSIYTFLHWLLFIKLEAFTVKEDILNIWLPLGLVWIPLLIWLNPRLKLLKLKTKNGDLPTLYLVIAWLGIALSTIMAQQYLVTATGKLTTLNSITGINKVPKTKYYTVKNSFVGKEQPGFHSTAEVSGKYNRDLTFWIFLVYPLFENGADTIHTQAEAWMGIKFSKTISNRLEDDEKEQAWERFYEATMEDAQKRSLQQFVYLDRVPPSDDLDGYQEALKRSTALKAEGISILAPVDEPFDKRGGNKPAWIFGSFGIGATVWLIMILIPKLQPSALNKYRKGR